MEPPDLSHARQNTPNWRSEGKQTTQSNPKRPFSVLVFVGGFGARVNKYIYKTCRNFIEYVTKNIYVYEIITL